MPALLAALYCLACKIQLTVFCGPKRYPAVFCEPKKCDRTAMPVLRHWRRNGMGVLSQFLHYRITNTLLLVHLNVLEAPCEHAEIANAGILKKAPRSLFCERAVGPTCSYCESPVNHKCCLLAKVTIHNHKVNLKLLKFVLVTPARCKSRQC